MPGTPSALGIASPREGHRSVPSLRKRPMIGRRSKSTAVLAFALLLGSGWASAEEQGIKVGEGRLHPYLVLEGNYQSFAALDPVTLDPAADLLWEIRPGLR